MKNRYDKLNNVSAVMSVSLMALMVFVLGTTRINAQGSGNDLNFDRDDGNGFEHVTLGSAPELQITGDLTLECWIYLTQLPSVGDLYALITYGANGEIESSNQLYRLEIINPGSGSLFRIVHEAGSGADEGVVASTLPQANQWMHVAVRRSVTNNLYQFVINGVSEAFQGYTNDPTGGTAGAGIIGAGFSGSGSGTTPVDAGHLLGEIDEVRIWNVIRTEAEIRNNMCQKLAGNESGLQGYWRLDSSSGTTATDETGNNDGTLVNMEDSDWVTSGAPIGDASIADYSSPTSVNLAHSDGDDATVNNINGSPSGVHIYRVDQAPNVTTPPGAMQQLDPLRYWGVFVVGGTSPTYDFVYNYAGHPGITNQATLDLATRADNSDSSWTEANAALNTGSNTLTLTGQSGTEYILGSETSDNPLPVQLSSFRAEMVHDGMQLSWVTQSEVNNLGFEIWRSVNNPDNFRLLASYQNDDRLTGAGNSNSIHQYSFLDENIEMEQTYYYKLFDVSVTGERNQLQVLGVEATEPVAGQFELFQNYPNPFNSGTNIAFQLPAGEQSALEVNLSIFDPLGRKIRTLMHERLATGQEYDVNWNGADDSGNLVPSGIYFYTLQAGSQAVSRKLIMMR